jgi:hypothetical protein
MECSQAKGITRKIRGHKLKSILFWQGALRQKLVKREELKTRAWCTALWLFVTLVNLSLI